MKTLTYITADAIKTFNKHVKWGKHPVVLIHQTNCFKTMGGGIAQAIAKAYPEAKEADDVDPRQPIQRLGGYSAAWVNRECSAAIINMYSQYTYGKNSCETHYGAMGIALDHIFSHLCNEFLRRGFSDGPIFIIPHGIGCGLAGGDWDRVKLTIEDSFSRIPKVLNAFGFVCKLENNESK